jgi:Ca2+-binding EF-hand superfamily protein
MKRREKKSETLDIRLPHEQKQAFMSATRAQGETASQALRRYIASYIEEAQAAEQTTPVQELTMTLLRHRIKTAMTASAAALGLFAFTAMPSAATPSAFDKLDKNKDGFITEGEILPGEDADIIAKLDTDGSGSVSREELEAAGNRIVIEKSSTETNDEGHNVTKKRVKVLEFSDGDISSSSEHSVEKRVSIRLKGDQELSKEELDTLIAEAMEDADLDLDGDVDVDIQIGKPTEE